MTRREGPAASEPLEVIRTHTGQRRTERSKRIQTNVTDTPTGGVQIDRQDTGVTGEHHKGSREQLAANVERTCVQANTTGESRSAVTGRKMSNNGMTDEALMNAISDTQGKHASEHIVGVTGQPTLERGQSTNAINEHEQITPDAEQRSNAGTDESLTVPVSDSPATNGPTNGQTVNYTNEISYEPGAVASDLYKPAKVITRTLNHKAPNGIIEHDMTNGRQFTLHSTTVETGETDTNNKLTVGQVQTRHMTQREKHDDESNDRSQQTPTVHTESDKTKTYIDDGNTEREFQRLVNINIDDISQDFDSPLRANTEFIQAQKNDPTLNNYWTRA